MKNKLYPCPYDEATRCVLDEPCLGCETFSKHLLASFDKAPARNMESIETSYLRDIVVKRLNKERKND